MDGERWREKDAPRHLRRKSPSTKTKPYKAGDRFIHDGTAWIVRQDHTAQAHQPPGDGTYAL